VFHQIVQQSQDVDVTVLTLVLASRAQRQVHEQGGGLFQGLVRQIFVLVIAQRRSADGGGAAGAVSAERRHVSEQHEHQRDAQELCGPQCAQGENGHALGPTDDA
jgi:hypothetical protein